MTDTPPESPSAAAETSPITPLDGPRSERRGLWIRLFLIAALPLLAFGALALQMTGSISLSTGTTDDPGAGTTLIVGLLLALAAAAGAAWGLDRAIGRRLDAAAETLESGDLGRLRELVGSRGWGGTRRLATAVRGAIAGAQESAGAGEQLKALQESADDLGERISSWSRSEIAPFLDQEEGEDADPLGALRAGLAQLARHLDERRQETLDAARMARTVVDEACGEIARTGMETGRTAREIASLASGLSELRKLTGRLAGEMRAPAEKEADAAPVADPSRWSRELRRAERALLGLASVRETVERIERASVRATLEAAAGQLAEVGRDRPALDLLRALRQAVVDCRHAQEGLESVENSLGSALSAVDEAAGEWTRSLATPGASNGNGSAPRQLSAAVNRIEHWAADTAARIERLSGVADRLAKQSQAAWAAARAGSEDLGGVMRRLGDEGVPPVEASGEPRADA